MRSIRLPNRQTSYRVKMLNFCKGGTKFCQHRRFLVRASIFLNFCVVTYVALQAVHNGSPRFDPLPSGFASGSSVIDYQQETITPQEPITEVTGTETDPSTVTDPTTPQTVTLPQNGYSIRCRNQETEPRYSQRGIFWIFNNYIKSNRYFECDESVTYTTHGDVTFLDNVLPLVQRWEGPISLAVYTPGSDYQLAVTSIRYLRECTDPAVRERVTFHLVIDTKHFPQSILSIYDTSGIIPEVNCTQEAPWEIFPRLGMTYKAAKRLAYPVNVLRNVARDNAQTHYVLASDSELYPNPGLVTGFLEMIRKKDSGSGWSSGSRRVYVLPIFEVYENQTVPETKKELVSLLKSGMAIPFHKKVCSYCHSIPKAKEWIADDNTDDDNSDNSLGVFHAAKRHKPHERWEPIYIGTRDDPPYDERLTWEGKSDKMTQGYALCVLDYDFLILDKAFLVHRPGVKSYRKDPVRDAQASRQSSLIRNTILKELKLMYGSKPECVL